MKGIVFFFVLFYILGSVYVAGQTPAPAAPDPVAGGTFTPEERVAIKGGNKDPIQQITSAKLKNLVNWKLFKEVGREKNALGQLSENQLKGLTPDQLKDVAEGDLKDPKDPSAQNWPDTKEGADALNNAKRSPSEPSAIDTIGKAEGGPAKINKMIKEGQLDKVTVQQIKFDTFKEWAENQRKEFYTAAANPGGNKDKYTGLFSGEEGKKYLDQMIIDNAGIQDVQKLGSQQQVAAHGNGQPPPGGGEQGQGAGGQQPPDGGGQQEGKGGDLGSALSGIGGVLQGIAALIGATKEEKEKEKSSDPQQLATSSPVSLCGEGSSSGPTGSAIAEQIVGQKCNRATETCSSEVAAPNTGVGTICCKSPCKPRPDPVVKKAAETIEKEKQNEIGSFGLQGEKGQIVATADGQTKQDVSKLNKATDKVEVVGSQQSTLTGSAVGVDGSYINVFNGLATNLYSLKYTQQGVENYGGLFLLDNTGIQKMSVGEQYGALTIDPTGIVLWELPGTTVYEAAQDLYETDTKVYAPQYGLWVAVPPQKSVPSPTGQFAHEFIFPTTGITFGHGKLTDQLKNILDASLTPQGDADVTIYAKGFQDLELLGNFGFFPILIRTFAKGSTHIIYDLNVGVAKKYKIKDKQYEYAVMQEAKTTKVKTSGGKIIEDSGSFPIRKDVLSQKQKRLLYDHS